MEDLYPQGPLAVPRHFARPSARYRRNAWLAMVGLALFVLTYCALAGGFVWIGYCAMAAAVAGYNPVMSFIGCACAWFLAVFMLKSLFFVRRGSASNGLELSRATQTQLFAFLDRLADEAGAPRPHRVFVSERVNAAVFYDLSVLNLLFPSRKNLEIGLGLVNVLSLGEFKAVCAHEFGHFAQRSMAISRWVYTAQQIAGHIVATRGALDKFLDALSRFDLRIAWLGFLLRLIVWAIRALTDTLFRVVLIAQRALSREMEMQADLVAVSLTGSDALIEALHKMPAADDAWDRTVGFLNSELAAKRITQDAFAVQTRMLELVGGMLGIADYGHTPERVQGGAGYRLFKAELAQPPRMWATHPLSHEREENAKRIYLDASTDPRSAWLLFDAVAELRVQVTARLLGSPGDAEPVEQAVSMQSLEGHFARNYHDRAYRGIYLNRSPVLDVAKAADLVEPLAQVGVRELAELYPESLIGELERLREMEKERALLVAVRDGVYAVQGGVVHYRGRGLRPERLAPAIAEVDEDIARARGYLALHDRRCRSVHHAAARQLGHGWDDYLQGLICLLHYADHVLADLRDVQAALSSAVAIATATHRASKNDVSRVLKTGEDLHDALIAIYRQAAAIKIGDAIVAKLTQPDWPTMLGRFGLGQISRKQINPWLQASRNWVAHTVNALSALRNAVLEQLLESEALIARHLREGGEPIPAPAAPVAPAQYVLATPGHARARIHKLDGWKRFQNAQGIVPTLARGAIACSIVGGVIAAGWGLGTVTVNIHNGLARTVRVNMDGHSTILAAYESGTLRVLPGGQHQVRTTDQAGHVIESFEASGDAYGHSVYNIAGASPLMQWTAVYGPAAGAAPRHLGNLRWSTTGADDVFVEPPHSVKTESGGATRQVLGAVGDGSANDALGQLDNESQRAALIAVHARWDAPGSPHLADWLQLESAHSDFQAVLSARLTDDPDDMMTLRARQDSAGSRRAAICATDRARATAMPEQADLAYLATRCIDDEAARNAAFDAGHQRWPDNAWFAYASAYTAAEQARWPQALSAMQQAIGAEPALRESGALDTARIRRMLAQNPDVDLTDLSKESVRLQTLVKLEHADDAQGPMRAYAALDHGRLEQAAQYAYRSQDEAYLLRLAAASDGAPRELVERALALPEDQGIASSTIWTAIALNMREHGRSDAFGSTLQKGRSTPEAARSIDAVLTFLQMAKKGSLDRAEAELDVLPPETRGEAYAAGVVLLGAKAPAAWRTGAHCLLFTAERPYSG